MFDLPPAQIAGNLRFVGDDHGPVLGYFEVESVKPKRIFIYPLDFRNLPNSQLYANFNASSGNESQNSA